MAPSPSPSPEASTIKPRLIIHGGAGAINPANLPPPLYAAHREALLSFLHSTASLLSDPDTTALDAAVHAVTLLELNPLYNAGRGAVFTTRGGIEHEASVMVSTPHPLSSSGRLSYRKRAVGVMRTHRVKHPILLAKEILVRGEEEDGGGAKGHVQIAAEEAEKLAEKWGLEMKRPGWFWDKKRWDQHRDGMGLGTSWGDFKSERRKADAEAGYGKDGEDEGSEDGMGDGEPGAEGVRRLKFGPAPAVDGCGYAEAASEDGGWNGTDYLPQGTVGAVVLDRFGTIAVATSTGGMTNKLPGRIGDTPTIGAGFWAESWEASVPPLFAPLRQSTESFLGASPLGRLLNCSVLNDCLPSWLASQPQDFSQAIVDHKTSSTRAVGMSGTGNGDSFLRLCCVRTVASMVRFSFPSPSLKKALSAMAGPGGILQDSAEDGWPKTGEGQGGIIGIELNAGQSSVVSDFNCGGMFRTWVDDDGQSRMMVFKTEYGKETV